MAAAQGLPALSAYASTTDAGAPSKTWPRTATQAAEALSVIDRTQHSRTAATTHCHTHRATTGSRSGQSARTSSRGATTEARAPSSNSAAGTIMAEAYERGATAGYGQRPQVTYATVSCASGFPSGGLGSGG